MKVLAFAATSSKKSINKQLAVYATQLLTQESKSHHDIEFLDLNDYELPLYSEDKEAELGQPQLAENFLNKIGDSDVVIISFAEHNGSYTTAYKNIFDWASRINPKVFQSKTMIFLATSPGPSGAANVLATAVASAPFFNGDVKGSFSLPTFYENFDSEQCRIINDELNENLQSLIKILQ